MPTVPISHELKHPGGGEEDFVRLSFRVCIDMILAELGMSSHERIGQVGYYMNLITNNRLDPRSRDLISIAKQLIDEYVEENGVPTLLPGKTIYITRDTFQKS